MIKTYFIIGIVVGLLISTIFLINGDRRKISGVIFDITLWPIALWLLIYGILIGLTELVARRREES